MDYLHHGGGEIGYQVAPILQPITDYDFDDDSDYASGTNSYPSSVLSSDYNFKYENGRRYFARRQVSYPLPNDDEEWNRLELTHCMWTLVHDGKLFKAPLGPEPLRILDIATGTGTWAIEVADQFQNSHVTGIDIAPVNPPWMPQNLDFHIEDIEDDWVFPENTFDLIHIRGMAGFISDWPRLIAQCFTALKPGGYIEFKEFRPPFEREDGTCDDNSILQKWTQLWEEGSLRTGKQWINVPLNFQTFVTAAGFVEVVKETVKLPTGSWHPEQKFKEIGRCMMKHWLEGAEGITLDMFTRVLAWEKAKVDEFLHEIRREVLNPKVNTSVTGWIICARKPLTVNS